MRRLGRWLALHGGIRGAFLLLQLLRHTWRATRHAEHRLRQKPVILAFWHSDLLVGVAEMTRTGRRDCATLASRSRDGEIAAKLAELTGITPIRGGSSKGQVEALRAMQKWADKGGSLLIAIDGPRGPRGVVKAGIVLLASQTGLPIIPGSATGARVVRFRSWDKMWFPKPFSKLEITLDEPMLVRPDATREELEIARRQLEKRLAELHLEPPPVDYGAPLPPPLGNNQMNGKPKFCQDPHR